MIYFIALVHQERGSAYGIQFPDVPACFSAADRLSDLINNATEALGLHLEGEDIPVARSLDDIRQDSEVAQELVEGAFLFAVPFIQLTGRIVRVNLTMDAGLLAAIDRTAKARKVTRSGFLADLARREISG